MSIVPKKNFHDSFSDILEKNLKNKTATIGVVIPFVRAVRNRSHPDLSVDPDLRKIRLLHRCGR